jgi:hypothetical protein
MGFAVLSQKKPPNTALVTLPEFLREGEILKERETREPKPRVGRLGQRLAA